MKPEIKRQCGKRTYRMSTSRAGPSNKKKPAVVNGHVILRSKKYEELLLSVQKFTPIYVREF